VDNYIPKFEFGDKSSEIRMEMVRQLFTHRKFGFQRFLTFEANLPILNFFSFFFYTAPLSQ